eukprot:TRINITY_DN45306_c0_g1_i4.p2 TRINITY_DN45306_c0_g1~~TRINITY_DN45306_c0_g1_i4.p2  ORF type:complete len:101 (-),score=7.17 TRINITY_DN45306_c0_g1_i4:178-480(-)
MLEERSTSTRENALFSLPLIQQQGSTKVLLITNKFHQFRSYLAFVKAAQDLKIQCEFKVLNITHDVENDGIDAIYGLYAVLREIAAIGWYIIRGYIPLFY